MRDERLKRLGLEGKSPEQIRKYLAKHMPNNPAIPVRPPQKQPAPAPVSTSKPPAK